MLRMLAAVAALWAIAPEAGAQAAYCVAGSSAASMLQTPQEMVVAMRERCRVGETIYLGAGQTGAIALLCDFTKTIVVTSGTALCLLGPPRELKN